jgi:Protein of unknown function (DUF2946)
MLYTAGIMNRRAISSNYSRPGRSFGLLLALWALMLQLLVPAWHEAAAQAPGATIGLVLCRADGHGAGIPPGKDRPAADGTACPICQALAGVTLMPVPDTLPLAEPAYQRVAAVRATASAMPLRRPGTLRARGPPAAA